jgi:putative transposase
VPGALFFNQRIVGLRCANPTYGATLVRLRKEHRKWVEEAIHHNRVKGREPEWTDAIAVGSEAFVDEIRDKLQARQMGRKVREVGGHYELREQGAAYNAHFAPEKVLLSTENTYCLDLNVE